MKLIQILAVSILALNLLFISCKKKTEFAEGELKWRYNTKARTVSSPAIGSDYTIYFTDIDNYLYAVSPNGKLKWKYKIGIPCQSPVIGAGGSIYVATLFYLYVIYPDSSLNWHLYQPTFPSSPAIGLDSTIYVSTLDFILMAFNHMDGSLKWRYNAPGNFGFSPVIDTNGVIYTCSKDSFVYAVTSNCSLKWRYKIDGYISSHLAIGNGNTIYLGTKDSCFYALNSDGTLKWRYKADDYLDYYSPVIDLEGTIYFGTDKLYALHPDGSIKCQYTLGGKVGTTPAIDSDGVIYFGSYDGYFYALNPDGSLKWRYKVDGTIISPTIGMDSTIYFGCTDGYLYAIKGSGTLADSPWPKFWHDLKNTGRVGGGGD
jgi:outer membrane protein assembly factor BamB